MNILITGGSGFLGSKIAKNFAMQRQNKIYIFDLKKNKDSKNIFFIKGDINNEKKLHKLILRKKINILMHFAASLGVEETEKNPSKVIMTNIEGTLNILNNIKKTNIKKIIFASSSEVYGDNRKKMMSENDLPMPKSIYGHSKIIGEELIKMYSKLYDIDYNIIRFFNVCGNEQRKDFVISKFADLIKKNKNITIYGNGDQIRSFCHVNDAAKGVTDVLLKGKNNETYNVGNNSEPIKIFDLAKLMINISKKKITIKKIPFIKTDRSAKREIYKRVPNLKKIKDDTNFKPKVSLNSIIKEFF
jgi:nucleoside-diphosphate-sugar epimerase